MEMDFEKSQFLREIQSLHLAMEECIERHGMQEHVVSIVLTGVVDIDPDGEEDTLRAIYSYNVHDEVVLEESFHFMRETYYKNALDGALDKLKGSNDESLDDLLGELGIDIESPEDE